MSEKRQTKPRHSPTSEQRSEVRALSSFGVPHDDIAKYIGIDPKTLRKYYRDEIDISALKANAQVAKFLFKAASGLALAEGATHADCLRAAMFWSKVRMDWSETQKLDHTSSDGSMARVDGVTIQVVNAPEHKGD